MGKVKYKLKRAKLKGKEKSTLDWEESTLLIISMNNSHYKSKHSLKQIIEWILSKTDKFDVIVGDYLHRTNQKIFFGMNENEAIKTSLKKGDELIEFFKQTADEMGVYNYRIRRTEEFYLKRSFSTSLNKIYKLYDNNFEFKQSIDSVIKLFFKRLNTFVISEKSAFEYCKQYLFEELVIFQMLYSEDKSIIVYPGKWTVFDSIINGNIGEILKTLSNYLLVELNFIKIK